MPLEVIMPRVDMDMTEGKIAFWYVRNGDRVAKGQALFDIETDKATMEVEAEADGVIDGIREEIGVPVPVGEPVAWLLTPGEALPQSAPAAAAPEVAAAAPAAAAAHDVEPEARGDTVPRGDTPPPDTPAAPTPVRERAIELMATDAPGPRDDHGRASPLARAAARRRALDLHLLRGSGPDGAVLARDLPRDTAGEAGLHLQWLARGRGRPVVLLHGFGADLGSWRPLAQQLDGLSLVGVDLPNHGKSPRAAVRSLDDVALLVHARLQAEGLDDVHLVGHSLGGGVAIALADLLGERLRSLTLIAPVGLGPRVNGDFVDGLCRVRSEPALRAWLRELVGDERVLSGSFVATAWHQLSAEGRQQALQAMSQSLIPDGTQIDDLRPRLKALRAPLKVLWGTADRIVPPHHADTLPPQAALHRLPGVGHLPQVEAAELTALLLRQQVAAAA